MNQEEAEAYDGPVLELYVSVQWNVQMHRIYERVPSGWTDWDAKQRDEFCDEIIEEYVSNNVEWGVIVHESQDAVLTASRRYWGGGYSSDQLESSYVNY